MRKLLGLVLFLAAAVAAWAWFARAPSYPDSYILTANHILTPDTPGTASQAIWVENGTIRAVGNIDDLDPQRTQKVIAFPNHVISPGLIEPHTHPIASALLGAAVDISGFRYQSRADVMARLKAAADETALTPWLIAYGWDPVRIADLEAPTLAELDAISPDRPLLILTQMLHEAYVNTAALAAAGFPPEHGARLRELEEVGQATAAIPAPSEAAVELLVRQQYQAYARSGFTTIGITGAVGRHPDPVRLLERIGQDSHSPVRSFLYLIDDQAGALTDLANPSAPRFGILGTKFWIDGSPFTGEAAVAEPYEDTDLVLTQLGIGHGHSGPGLEENAGLRDQIMALHRQGHQIALHVQGERAVDLALEAFAAAQAAYPNPDLNHRLEHNALITASQITQAVELGLSLGFFVDHITYYGDRLEELFGAERAARYMPTAHATRANAVVTLHGDHPATPLHPFQTFETAVTRQSLHGGAIGADQALTPQEALAAMTENAARQLQMGMHLGRIAPGMRADFTILSRNPLDVPRDDLSEIKVVTTIVEGQPVDLRPLWLTRPGLMARVVWGLF